MKSSRSFDVQLKLQKIFNNNNGDIGSVIFEDFSVVLFLFHDLFSHIFRSISKTQMILLTFTSSENFLCIISETSPIPKNICIVISYYFKFMNHISSFTCLRIERSITFAGCTEISINNGKYYCHDERVSNCLYGYRTNIYIRNYFKFVCG